MNILKIIRTPYLYFLVCLCSLLSGCSNNLEEKTVEFSYVIVNKYPHDPNAFTQGLVWDNGAVDEGTGLLGRSSLRQVDLGTGKIIRRIDHDKDIFAEGITVFQDRVYQLTWKNKIIFVYDKQDFSLISSYQYPREGWGVTHDNLNIIVSEGTDTLYFLDPLTLGEKRSISVHDNSSNIHYLNELEYIEGKIYANIWKSNLIAIINPDNGIVEGWLDLTGLYDLLSHDRALDVLNGIMYDQKKKKLFVTGKLWPILFEIKVVSNE